MEHTAAISPAKRFVPVVFSLVITAICLFGAAGTLSWWNAWVLLGLNFAASTANVLLLWHSPGLIAERSNVKAGKSYDKFIMAITVLLGPVATWVTAGLSVRFHWADGMPQWAFLAGAAVAVVAAGTVSWAMRSNRFFSAVVRIQKDRGHLVVTDGPYRLVRHPGYAGMAAFTLATPLILNRAWAFIPAAITAAFTVLRTVLEDRTLRHELDGYAEYAGNVKSKLVPGIW